MKKSFLPHLAILVMVVGLHAFRLIQGNGIIGRVTPPDEVEAVWAFSGSDTTRTTVQNGAFAIDVKTGIWKVVIDAKPPFRDVIFEKVEVKENQATDLGEIRLQQ